MRAKVLISRGKERVQHYSLKELALLTHLVKLRRSCQEMILPDIRKCSKSDQIMGANRYLCCKSLGAIRQSLWPKNSHDMAFFPYILTSLVTFLVVRTTFMHLSSAERTQTLLTHVGWRYGAIFASPGTYMAQEGSKVELSWSQNRTMMAGLLRGEDPYWKPLYEPYHI